MSRSCWLNWGAPKAITRIKEAATLRKKLPKSRTRALQLCHELKYCTSVRSALEELLTRRQLLRNHARCGDHCKAAVVELLGLHFFELFRIRGLQTQGVKSKVSSHTVRAYRPRLGILRILRITQGRIEREY